MRLNLTVESPPQLDASLFNDSFDTGKATDLSVDIVDPTPGVYPIVVHAVGEDGSVGEAIHTVTITGAAARVLFDGFEGPDQWTATVTASSNGSDGTAEPTDGGNPGSQRRMTHLLPGTDDGDNNPTQITVVHVFTGGGWDPATDGALTSLNYSVDQIEHEPPFDGAAIGTLFVIIQNGTTYTTSINDNNAYSNTTWKTVRVDGLTPADFSPAPGPDFSATGAPITFGYLRSNTTRSPAGLTTQHGIGNWTVELFSE